MKVRNAMLAVEHADHDAEESGQFRHSFSFRRWFISA
jgi:hypothetical protein